MERTRRWWYRPVEDPQEVNLALRFTLSQKGVAVGVPPAFLDIAEQAIEVGRSYEPITDAEYEQIRKLAGTCHSIFRREEEQVAYSEPRHEEVYPDSPHECCPYGGHV